MGFLADNCTFSVLSEDQLAHCIPFDCGHKDLNDFFASDCLKYSNELLGKSYCFLLDEDPTQIVCAFTISNDSIKTNFIPTPRRNKLNRNIPNLKRSKSYPAVLIGRLGVSDNFKKHGIGRELMDFIKSWFIDSENKTGCRFIVVDSYNEEGPITYYQKNGFQFLFNTEEEEKEYMGLPEEESLRTRLMHFDLILLSSE